IDFSFAPCVDLDWGVSEVIGNRAFHTRPAVVAELAQAFCRGLKSAGMVAIAKHFPGHGAVVADSHHKLPVDRREYGDILEDMQPYERLIGHRLLAGVMLAHVVFAQTDPLPAGFSKYWVQTQLRAQLSFDGAVFCDDLSMKAAASLGSMPERARLALDAGCDMLLVCNDRPGAAATVAALRDYSNPLSLVRLARLHGTGQTLRESLRASDEWQAAAASFERWLDRPQLELDA
ncbi:MAG TPA: beta-N-acetylhexosaminidase, partial [Woeseiaceae bacterium]